jgi:hypothetical protein
VKQICLGPDDGACSAASHAQCRAAWMRGLAVDAVHDAYGPGDVPANRIATQSKAWPWTCMMKPFVEGIPKRFGAFIVRRIADRKRRQLTAFLLRDKVFDSDPDVVVFMQSAFNRDVGCEIWSEQRFVIAIPAGQI